MSFFDRVTGNKTRKDDLDKEQAKLLDERFSTKSFFKLLWAKKGVISKVNLLMILLMLPLVFTLFGLAGSFFGYQISDVSNTPISPLFAQFDGISRYEVSSAIDAVSLPHVMLSTVNVDNTATVILKCIGLIVLFTFGPLNIGCAYVMRNTIKEQPVFVWSDFFGAIKKNIRQAIIFGIIDAVLICAIPYALMFYYSNAFTFPVKMLLFAMIMITVLYMIMRVYIYLMIVTFDLNYRKLFKNAFILSSAGIKRSLMMVLGVIAVVLINVYLFILLKGIGTVLPFIFTFAFIMFICYYCGYPVVKKYMIDPYYDENGKPKASGDSNQ